VVVVVAVVLVVVAVVLVFVVLSGVVLLDEVVEVDVEVLEVVLFATQSSFDLAPAGLHLPGLQSLQVLAPNSCDHLPEGHSSHAFAPARLQ